MKTQANNTTKTIDRLLPVHIGGKVEVGQDLRETYFRRSNEINSSVDLEELLRNKLTERGYTELPSNQNLALLAIEEFRELVIEATLVRKALRRTSDIKEQRALLSALARLREQIDEYVGLGKPFERAYREYLKERRDFRKFKALLYELNALKRGAQSLFANSIQGDEKFSKDDLARVYAALRRARRTVNSDLRPELRALAAVYPVGSKEYEEAKQNLLPREASSEPPPTPYELQERIKRVEAEAKGLWQNPLVRYFWGRAQNEKLLADIAQGKDVIEDPKTIELLNKLYEFETTHTRTTVGAVLVGPPGVGKTTLLRHYLECMGRSYVYVDLSEDVTRYLLYGSKELRLSKSNFENHRQLACHIKDMNEEELKAFITQNAGAFKEIARISGDEAVVAVLNIIDRELLGEGAEDSLIAEVREHLRDFAERAFHRELASEFARIVKQNGWRDGIIIAALRRGDSIIFDEFPHFRNWHMINSLMTAKPGELWYFADNQEWIEIPQHWRMYFTGNIGSRHGGFVVSEKMASRVAEVTMEIGYPDKQHELSLAIALLSDRSGYFVRSEQDLIKLAILVNEAFPKIRSLIERERHTIPVSFRTLRAIAEKLVRMDPNRGIPLGQPRLEVTFDEAVFQVMVASYSLFENPKIPREIVDILTSVGLLLDDSVKEKVLNYIDNSTYQERKKMFSDMKEDLEQIKAILLGEEYSFYTKSGNELPKIFSKGKS